MKPKSLVLALILIGSLAIEADSATLLNGSFENVTSGSPDDWNPSGNLTAFIGQGATDGSYAIAFSWDNQPSNGQIWQTIETIADVNYRLSFDFGKYSVNQPDLVARLAIEIFNGDDFSGIVLLNEVVADSTNTTSGFYMPFEYEFTALGASSTLRFQDSSDAQVPGGGFDAMLDNVEVNVVPEPMTSVLLIGGAAILLATFRRKTQ